jgi:hypothetical protein
MDNIYVSDINDAAIKSASVIGPQVWDLFCKEFKRQKPELQLTPLQVHSILFTFITSNLTLGLADYARFIKQPITPEWLDSNLKIVNNFCKNILLPPINSLNL